MSVQKVFVAGVGAVSPAGWSASDLAGSCSRDPLPTTLLPRPGKPVGIPVRRVPPPNPRPAELAHPRLRRSSPVSQFGVAAGFEALAQAGFGRETRAGLGIVFSVMSGSVVYSRRFFEEVLRDPSTASPLLFPETVFNAPASHLGAAAGATAPNYTLVGDAGMFVQGLGLAADWIRDGLVRSVLVVGSEEADWTSAGALVRFHRRAIPAEGAGAVLLTAEAASAKAVFAGITPAEGFGSASTRRGAAARVLGRLDPEGTPAWFDAWSGQPPGPGEERGVRVDGVLGDGLGALGAWACVAAATSVMQGGNRRAVARVVGANQQVLGARFEALGRPAEDGPR